MLTFFSSYHNVMLHGTVIIIIIILPESSRTFIFLLYINFQSLCF